MSGETIRYLGYFLPVLWFEIHRDTVLVQRFVNYCNISSDTNSFTLCQSVKKTFCRSL